MFEFMYKIRMPVLLAIVLSMAGFGVWAYVASPSGEQEDREVATFQIPGEAERQSLRSPSVVQTTRYFSLLNGINPGALRLSCGITWSTEDNGQAFVMAFEALREVAKKSGFIPNPVDVDNLARQLAQMQAFYEFRQVLTQVQVPDETRDFAADFIAVRMMDQALYQPQFPAFSAILEEYQKAFPVVTSDYVSWTKKTPQEFSLDLTQEADKATLKEWFDKNPDIARRPGIQIPEQVDLGVVVVRFDDKSLEDLVKKIDEPLNLAAVTVTDEEIDRRLQAGLSVVNGEAQRSSWGWFLANEAQRRAAEGATGDQPAPEEVLKPQIRRELAVAKRLGEVFDAASTSDFKSAALALGFEYNDVDGLTAEDLMSKHPTFAGGPNLWMMVRGQAIEKLGTPEAPGEYQRGAIIPYVTTTNDGSLFVDKPVFDQPGRMVALFSLRDHRLARTPEFDEILAKVYEEWQNRQSQTDFTERGTNFTAKLKEWVETNVEAVRTKKAELEAEAERKIAEEIAQRELSREREADAALITEIEKRHRASIEGDLRPVIAEHQGAGFKAVAEALGYEVKSFGPIVAEGGINPNYPETLSPEERMNRYLHAQSTMVQLAQLEENRVTAFARTDYRANVGAHFHVTSKVKPSAEEMLTRPDRWMPISNRLFQQEFAKRTPVTFADLKKSEWFSLAAPEYEERLAEGNAPKRSAGSNDSERQRIQEERIRRLHGGMTPPPPSNADGDQAPR